MSHISSELLDRYLAHQATIDERAQVEAWLAADPAHIELVAVLRGSVGTPDVQDVPGLTGEDATWTRIRRRTLAPASGPESVVATDAAEPMRKPVLESVRRVTPPRVPSSRVAPPRVVATAPSRRWGWVAGAATIAVVAVVALFGPRGPRESGASRTYATRAGQRATIALLDGSRVVLAPQSVLTVPATFGDVERHVTLRGEGYFDVQHVTGTPFIVQTGRVSTRVVGTVFGVRHYASDPDVRVAVVSGKVIAGAASRPAVTLVAGTVGRLTDSTATAAMSDADLGWVNGTLVFHDTPVPDALARLSQWYGIEFRINDTALTHRHVTGAFDGESQAEALATLQTVLKVSMTFESTPGHAPVVTLVRRDAQHTPAERRTHRRDRSDVFHASTEVGR